jgi:hypothetical protein
MAKVVTEKPRRGSSERSKKYARRLTRDEIDALVTREADDDAARATPTRVDAVEPKRAKVSRHGQYGWDAKEFTDVLNPLRRYLYQQVGRPWNKVYSEMTVTLDKRSLTGLHIWSHVKLEVEMHARLGEDGKTVYPAPRFRWVDEQNRRPVEGFYVHPRTGLLCFKAGPYTSPVATGYSRRPREDPNVRPIDALTDLRRIKGLWYHCTYAMKEVYHSAVRGRNGYTYRSAYFEDVRTLQQKRQLSRKELRAHDLRNEVRA